MTTDDGAQPEPTLWSVVSVRTLAESHPGRLRYLPSDADLADIRVGDFVAVMIVAGEPPNLGHWTLHLRVVDVWPTGHVVGSPLRDLSDLAITMDDVFTVEPGDIFKVQPGERDDEAIL